jgi:hypothetical protein
MSGSIAQYQAAREWSIPNLSLLVLVLLPPEKGSVSRPGGVGDCDRAARLPAGWPVHLFAGDDWPAGHSWTGILPHWSAATVSVGHASRATPERRCGPATVFSHTTSTGWRRFNEGNPRAPRWSLGRWRRGDAEQTARRVAERPDYRLRFQPAGARSSFSGGSSPIHQGFGRAGATHGAGAEHRLGRVGHERFGSVYLPRSEVWLRKTQRGTAPVVPLPRSRSG